MRLLTWALIQSDCEEAIWTQGDTRACGREGRPGEHPARRRPLAAQAEKPQRKPNLLTLGSWSSSLENCEKM